MTRRRRRVPVFVLSIALAACAKEPSAVDVAGKCADVHKDKVCTWAKTLGDKLVEVGATVPMASIENAPGTDPNAMAWPPVAAAVIDVPEAARQTSGFNHLTMYWESGGHPPGPYMTPHFDFHFYTIGNDERMAIDCKDNGKPAALPTAFGLPDIPLPPDMAKMIGVPSLIGLCIPQMGMHSLLQSEMDSKDTFRGSMVIGYYHGKPVFIEPMLTKAMLMEKKSFDLPIPQIPGMGAHPTKFQAVYDAAKNSYRFTFSDFVA